MANTNGKPAVELVEELTEAFLPIVRHTWEWHNKGIRREAVLAIASVDATSQQLPVLREALVAEARAYDATHTDHDPRD